jgi:hypothetical protein
MGLLLQVEPSETFVVFGIEITIIGDTRSKPLCHTIHPCIPKQDEARRNDEFVKAPSAQHQWLWGPNTHYHYVARVRTGVVRKPGSEFFSTAREYRQAYVSIRNVYFSLHEWQQDIISRIRVEHVTLVVFQSLLDDFSHQLSKVFTSESGESWSGMLLDNIVLAKLVVGVFASEDAS